MNVYTGVNKDLAGSTLFLKVFDRGGKAEAVADDDLAGDVDAFVNSEVKKASDTGWADCLHINGLSGDAFGAGRDRHRRTLGSDLSAVVVQRGSNRHAEKEFGGVNGVGDPVCGQLVGDVLGGDALILASGLAHQCGKAFDQRPWRIDREVITHLLFDVRYGGCIERLHGVSP